MFNLDFKVSKSEGIIFCRPTAKPSERSKNSKFDVGIADDQARDFDFVATEMKYDSTGMFHWTPSRPIEDCILVCFINFKESLVIETIFTGQEPSSHDSAQWSCGGVSLC